MSTFQNNSVISEMFHYRNITLPESWNWAPKKNPTLKTTHLNTGTGNACEGQRSRIGRDRRPRWTLYSSTSLSFGGTDPMGSEDI